MALIQAASPQRPAEWLQRLAEPDLFGDLSLECWGFDEPEQTDLEKIVVDPFLGKDGGVKAESGLSQPAGAGTQLLLHLGQKSKVKVRWSCAPKNAGTVSKWRVEVCPSRSQYGTDVAGTDLPFVETKGKTKTGTIKMHDVDVDNLTVRAVQVRVVALDGFDNELHDRSGQVIEGLSEEFWLAGPDLVEESPLSRGRRETVANLPFGRLTVAVSSDEDELRRLQGNGPTSRSTIFQFLSTGDQQSLSE